MPLDETKPADTDPIVDWPGYLRETRDLVNSIEGSAMSGFSGLSATNLTIGNGDASLTVETGKSFVGGQPILLADEGDPTTNWMWGSVKTYNSVTGVLVVTVTKTLGSGTIGGWIVSMSPDPSLDTHVDATVAHGATGAVVGTTNAQTLTNKTLTSPVLNGTLSGTAIEMAITDAVDKVPASSAVLDLVANPVNVVSINTGSMAGFRNKVINGCCRIAGRGDTAITQADGFKYGGCDRIAGYIGGANGSGTLKQMTASWATSGYVQALYNVTTIGAHECEFVYKIAADDCNGLSGGFTVSSKLAHDIGGNCSSHIDLYRPNIKDDFTNLTAIATSVSATTVPDGLGTGTEISYYRSSADLSKGLLIRFSMAATDVTGRTFQIGDIQVTPGNVVGVFEQRPIELEKMLCEVYLPTFIANEVNSPVGHGLVANSSTEAQILYKFKTTPRVPPTGIVSSVASQFALQGSAGITCTALSYYTANKDYCWFKATVASGLSAGEAKFLYANAIGASIFFTGCEL